MLVAETAIRTMAEHGYQHDDLEWRHVALLPRPPTDETSLLWTVQPVLIDLHRLRRMSDTETVDAVVEASLNILKQRLLIKETK